MCLVYGLLICSCCLSEALSPQPSNPQPDHHMSCMSDGKSKGSMLDIQLGDCSRLSWQCVESGVS